MSFSIVMTNVLLQAVSGLMEKDSQDASSDDGSQHASNSAAEDGPGDSLSGDESAPIPAVNSAKLSRTSASSRSKKTANSGVKKSSKVKWPNS